MKSRISFFDAGVFKNILRRFMPLWIAYFGMMFIVLPFSQFIDTGFLSCSDVIQIFATMSGIISTIMSFVAAIICAVAVYSFMYNARTTGLICSIPVRREAVFCSAYLAGLLPILVSNIVNGLLLLLLSAGQEFFGNAVLAYLQWLAIFTMQYLLFYGIAVFLAMMTGVGVVLPVLYGIMNFLAIGMEAVVRWIINPFIYGFSVDDSYVLELLSPCWYLGSRIEGRIDCIYTYADTTTTPLTNVFDHAVTNVYMQCDMWELFAVYCAVGILLSVAALFMYRKRRMECVGDVIAVPSMRPVFKYGVTFCAALCTGLMFYYMFDFDSYSAGLAGAIVMTIFMCVGAFIGYFVSEMLLRRSFHVFKDGWLGYIVSCACCFILVGCCYIDVLNLETRTPNIDKIDHIYFSQASITITDPEYFDDVTALQLRLVENRDYHCKAIDGYLGDYNGSTDCTYVSIDYYLKDGSSECRGYYLRIGEKNDDADELDRILNLPGNTNAGFPGDDKPVTVDTVSYANLTVFRTVEDGTEEVGAYELSPALTADLYNNAIKQDLEAGNLGKVSAYRDYYSYYGDYEKDGADRYILSFEISVPYADDGTIADRTHYYYYDIEIGPECEYSNAWLDEHTDLILSLSGSDYY